MAYYQFSLPMDVSEGYALVKQVCENMGKIKQDIPNSTIEIRTKPIGLSSSLPFIFYMRAADDGCEVIVSYTAPKFVMTSKTESGETVWDVPDRVWSHIIDEFQSIYPSFPLRSGKPTVVYAEPCDDGMGKETVSRENNFSLGRAAIGGSFFGGTGALVGGFSGTKKSKAQTRNVFSSTALFRVLYSNGRVIERTVKKNSREYAELMARRV